MRNDNNFGHFITVLWFACVFIGVAIAAKNTSRMCLSLDRIEAAIVVGDGVRTEIER